MRAVVRETGVTARVEDTRATARQTRVVVKKVQPWSVFKFSLLFYFCLMLVFLFALLILYWVLFVIGVLGVVVWSFVNLFVTLLYNLVSDVVGGIQITLGDRR